MTPGTVLDSRETQTAARQNNVGVKSTGIPCNHGPSRIPSELQGQCTTIPKGSRRNGKFREVVVRLAAQGQTGAAPRFGAVWG